MTMDKFSSKLQHIQSSFQPTPQMFHTKLSPFDKYSRLILPRCFRDWEKKKLKARPDIDVMSCEDINVKEWLYVSICEGMFK